MNSPASGTTRSERPSTRNGQWQCGDLGTEAYADSTSPSTEQTRPLIFRTSRASLRLNVISGVVIRRIWQVRGQFRCDGRRSRRRLILFCGVCGLIAIAAETLHEAYAEAERERASCVGRATHRAVAARAPTPRTQRPQRILAVLRLQANRSPEAK